MLLEKFHTIAIIRKDSHACIYCFSNPNPGSGKINNETRANDATNTIMIPDNDSGGGRKMVLNIFTRRRRCRFEFLEG